MEVPEQPREWVGGIDLWMTLAATVIAILIIVLATLPSQAQTRSGVPACPVKNTASFPRVTTSGVGNTGLHFAIRSVDTFPVTPN